MTVFLAKDEMFPPFLPSQIGRMDELDLRTLDPGLCLGVPEAGKVIWAPPAQINPPHHSTEAPNHFSKRAAEQ
ncbi:hypothetical protein FOPE_02170 [Fonsecaea pedrosoi]|nr:hypothetical protein FOPE_02170 [Fonsecaea pedrosoi]